MFDALEALCGLLDVFMLAEWWRILLCLALAILALGMFHLTGLHLGPGLSVFVVVVGALVGIAWEITRR
jgi:hypothetical protein